MKFSVNSRRGKVKHLDSEGSLTPSPIWVDNDNERRRKYLPLEKGLRRGTLETQQIFIRLETADFFLKFSSLIVRNVKQYSLDEKLKTKITL